MGGQSKFRTATGSSAASRPLRSWAEIDLGAVRHNFKAAAETGRGVIAIIKADGYGHGATEIAQSLESEPGVLAFGVATLAEALSLRDTGISAPILLLGTALSEEREKIARAGFWTSISSLEEAKAFDSIGARLGIRIPAHLIVDTGMGRMGVGEDQFDAGFARMLAGLQNLDFVGLASHFPSADEDSAFTREQAKRFGSVIDTAADGGLNPEHIHLANSAGILGFADEIKSTNAVRPGLLLYGVSPIPEFQHRLRPALSLKTKVTLVRDLPPGHGISYGRTFITPGKMRVATLAIGYGDGLQRHLSGNGSEILIAGARCPLLGRVTMDQIMADVSLLGDKVQPGDEAVLIGKQGDEEITATEMATDAGTIPWEIFTSLTKRVPRLYAG